MVGVTRLKVRDIAIGKIDCQLLSCDSHKMPITVLEAVEFLVPRNRNQMSGVITILISPFSFKSRICLEFSLQAAVSGHQAKA